MYTHDFAHPVRNVGEFGVEHGMIVADFGAGSGAYTRALADAVGDTGTVYAIDIQSDLLRKLHNDATKNAVHTIEILCVDLEKKESTKLRTHSVDRVLISNTLFQLEDKNAPLIEARRILKPHGKLIIIDWTESFRGLGPPKHHVVPQEVARTCAEAVGFTFEREFKAGAHHYGVILSPRIA